MNPWIPHLLRAAGRGSILPSSGQTFYASLKTSLVPEVGTGGPTWSRATAAWRFNDQGYLRKIPSGCAEFGGARLVVNTVRTKSEDFSNAAWAKNALTTPSANTLLCANATSAQNLSQGGSYPAVTIGQSFVYGIRAQYVNDGVAYLQISANGTGFGPSQYINVSLLDGSFNAVGCTGYVTLVSSGVYDIALKVTATASGNYDGFTFGLANSLSDTRFQAFVGDGIKSVTILRAWSVDVTGRDASYVPEYVSVGVAAAPYFGAGTDGAKYFDTDWQGAPLPAASLLGFRRESATTNNLLHCRDLSNAAWSTKTNITAAKTATGLDGIANSATALTATAEDAIILQPTSGIASAARCASAYVERVTGTGTISFTQDGGSTWTDITDLINSSTWSRVQITSTLANPSVGFKFSTAGDSINVDVVQNESGAVATSPIVTTTATVTRNADALTYQTAGNINFSVGSSYAMFKSSITSIPRYAFHTSYTAGSLISTAYELTSWRVYDGTSFVTATGLDDFTVSMVKRAVAWGGSELKVCGKGLSPTVGAFDGTMGSGAIIDIGSSLDGYIGDVAFYNYKMTDAELQEITT